MDVAAVLDPPLVNNDNDDAIKTEAEHVYYLDRNELLQIIETIQNFSLFSKDGAIVQSYTNDFARIIDQKAGKQQLEIISEK